MTDDERLQKLKDDYRDAPKRRDFAYGKRLATGAVALQRMIVKKAYACS